jgi:hypothetical protein
LPEQNGNGLVKRLHLVIAGAMSPHPARPHREWTIPPAQLRDSEDRGIVIV